MSPEAFAAFLQGDMARWPPLIAAPGCRCGADVLSQ
jgi:hypothetical protein